VNAPTSEASKELLFFRQQAYRAGSRRRWRLTSALP